MKKSISVIFLLFLLAIDCMAQEFWGDNVDCAIILPIHLKRNYPKVKIDNVSIWGLNRCCVLEETYLDVHHDIELKCDPKVRKVTDIQYYDGFGNPRVKYRDKFVLESNQIHDYCEYDALGRKKLVWETLREDKSLYDKTIQSYDFIFPRVSKNDLERKSLDVYRDSRAMQECYYDEMGRLVYTTTSGDDWVDISAPFDARGVKTEYITNESMSVIKYSMNKYGGVDTKNISYYPPLTLTGTKVTDEDGKTIETYKDMFDNVVLERRDGNNDTYYVYKDGLLRVVVPPLFQQTKEVSLLYKYKYDGWGRCVEKTLPGCQPIKYWYDMHGRLAFMQDNRMKSARKYRFYLYDRLGRLVVQGMCTSGAGTVDSTYAARVFYGSGGKQVDNSNYYVDTMYQLDNPTLEIVNYYDGYDCVNTAAFSNAKSTWNLKSKSDVCTSSLQTAQMVTDNNGKRYYRVMYYDEKGRCTEMNSTSIDGYFIKTNTSYSFTDKPTKTVTRTYKGALSSLQHTLIDSIKYDTVCDLPEKEYIKLDNNPEECIADNVYDGLGRLVESKSNNGNIRDLYEYDLHGWLTSHQNFNSDVYYAPIFSERLYYADGPNPKPCYNGNISAQVYTDSRYDNYCRAKGYMFKYDGMDRMTHANYAEGNDLSIRPSVDYSESVEYNANSSITFLQRMGESVQGPARIDNITFNYNGNKLSFAIDTGAPSSMMGDAFHFVDGYDYYGEYGYDGCGSLTRDKNKGVRQIAYDFNGMPTSVWFENGSITEYVYTSDGVKLKTIHRTAVDGIEVVGSSPYLSEQNTQHKDSTLYVGAFEVGTGRSLYYFANGYMDIIKGRVAAYNYLTTDHLGNVRHVAMCVSGRKSSIVQTNNYYPFGGLIKDGENRYDVQTKLYNGKEYDRMHGLNLYDYSARQYDPAIGQFTSMDPLCEKYYHISPYAYCAGNPVNAVDPSGKLVLFINGKIGGGSPKAGESYWNGRNSSFVRGAVSFFKDKNVFFSDKDYKYLSSAKNRMNSGYEYAKSQFGIWKKSMSIGETVKLVSHSMGGAFSKGVEKFLKENGLKVEYNVMINTYQVDEIPNQDANETIDIDYQNTDDPVLFWFDDNLGYGELENSEYKIREESNENGYLYKHRSPIDANAQRFWALIRTLLSTSNNNNNE